MNIAGRQIELHSNDREQQAAWLDIPLVRLPPRAIGGMVARPIPGQRALLAKRFARRPSGRPLELSDVLSGIAAALA